MIAGLRLSWPTIWSPWSALRSWIARRLDEEQAKIPKLADLMTAAGLETFDQLKVKAYQLNELVRLASLGEKGSCWERYELYEFRRQGRHIPADVAEKVATARVVRAQLPGATIVVEKLRIDPFVAIEWHGGTRGLILSLFGCQTEQTEYFAAWDCPGFPS